MSEQATTHKVIECLIAQIHECAVSHGFWPDGVDRNVGELVALIHSEASELLESVRKPGTSEHIPPFTGEEEECADIVIRIFDYAGGRELNLAGAMEAKIAFNLSRKHKHDGKAF